MRDVFPSECGSRRGRWRGLPAVVAVPRARSSARTRDFRRGEKQIAFAEVHFPALRHAPDEARSLSFATAFRRVRAARVVHNPPRFPDSTQSRVPARTRRRRDALLLTGRFPRFAFFAGCAQHIFSAPVEQQCPRCAPTRDATARGNCRVRTRHTDAPNARVGETRGGKTAPRGGCPEGINCQNSVQLGAKIWFWPAARPQKRR